MSLSHRTKPTPIAISRQTSQQYPSIADLERISSRAYSELGPKTTSDDDEIPILYPSNMSQIPSVTVPAASVLGQQTFRGGYNKTSHYSIFGSMSTTTPDITTLPPSTNQLTPRYTPPEKFDGNPNHFEKWREDCALYIYAHPGAYNDDHSIIMFMLLHMNKKALVWRTEFMAAHTTSSGAIHLGTIGDFIAALRSAFSPFDAEGESLQRLHKLRQHSRPVDEFVSEFVSEFRILTKRAGLTDTSQLVHIFRQGLDQDIAIQAIRKGPTNSLQAWIEAAKQGEEIVRMERVYLGRKSGKRTYRILAKERHYTHPNGERPDLLSKDPNAMDVDEVQAILENYKNSIQDEEGTSENEEENHQYIQDVV